MVTVTARFVVGSERVLPLCRRGLAQGGPDGWRASKPHRPVHFDLFEIARFPRRLDPDRSLDSVGRFDRIASTNLCNRTCKEHVDAQVHGDRLAIPGNCRRHEWQAERRCSARPDPPCSIRVSLRLRGDRVAGATWTFQVRDNVQRRMSRWFSSRHIDENMNQP
jgi:hypothetical protein